MKFFKLLVLVLAFCLSFSITGKALQTSAKSSILINADTLGVLYSDNAEIQLPMASTTKIMTALILAEQNTPDRIVKTTAEMVYVEGSSMGLKVGDTVTFSDLLYGILLPSGNDAANTAAIAIAGSTEKFALLMNKRAQEIGLHNTNFVTPSGLDAEEHYTTAHDLAVLTAFALKNEAFLNAASSKSRKVTISGNSVTLTNHNKLLNNYEGCIGVKTGYTSKSGRCLVSAAKRGSITLVAVTLNDGNDWSDHKALLDYGFSVTENSAVFPKSPNKIPTISNNITNVEIECKPLEIGLSVSDKIVEKVFAPSVLFLPLKQGEVIGYTEFYSGDHLIKKENIIVKNNYVEEPIKITFIERLFKTFIVIFRSI